MCLTVLIRGFLGSVPVNTEMLHREITCGHCERSEGVCSLFKVVIRTKVDCCIYSFYTLRQQLRSPKSQGMNSVYAWGFAASSFSSLETQQQVVSMKPTRASNFGCGGVDLLSTQHIAS
jgi:hypothetical protein